MEKEDTGYLDPSSPARSAAGTAEALNNRGVALDQLGRLEDALASFDRALALFPDYLEALNNRASVLIGLKQPAAALASCDKALAIRPDIGQILNNRGIALRDLGRKDEAVTAFRQALVVQPDRADVQTNLGVTLRELGHLELAEASLRQALPARTPQVFQSLATVLYEMGKVAEATRIYQQWLAHEPDNPIPRHMTAAAGGTVPERATDEYVAAVFDDFAETFDSTLARLQYRAPQILCGMLQAERGQKGQPARILDAGCGTGLSGPLLRPMASQLVGIDLSAGMLRNARKRVQYYDELVVAELCEYMSERPGAFDVVVIADTLIYFGVLEPAFRAAYSALAPGGTLAFTLEGQLETEAGPGYRLEPHGRYTHRRTYVEQALRETGYKILSNDTVVLRRERDADVQGFAILARKIVARKEG